MAVIAPVCALRPIYDVAASNKGNLLLLSSRISSLFAYRLAALERPPSKIMLHLREAARFQAGGGARQIFSAIFRAIFADSVGPRNP